MLRNTDPVQLPVSPNRGGVSEEAILEIRATIVSKLTLSVGKSVSTASPRDWYVATALAVRDRAVHRWLQVKQQQRTEDSKRVYYLSLEFLIGRLLKDMLHNLGITEIVRHALGDLGVDLERLSGAEPDAALGNGGLGRLAACFMDSMASLSIPGYGYGIRYDHGLFRQVIVDGVQHEYPENWLSFGNPWEFERPEIIYDIGFGGWVDHATAADTGIWHPAEIVQAVAYDTPIVGWRGGHVTPLRLWSARAADPLSLEAFNSGDHFGALSDQVRAEAISKVLYPSDETPAGQELRLRQEYFFVSASLQDLVARHLNSFGDLRSLPDKAAIQLNDTHPSIAVGELMRILIDLHRIGFEEAWDITVRTLSYTNHTLLPEALETWPVPLLERVLPRHMQIIYLINAHHLAAARRIPDADDRLLESISLIDESGGRRVRMGHLAFIGSHKVNGVSALHSNLLGKTVFRDLDRVYPDRIVNKTNGITFRRWLHQANPGLTALLCDICGPSVLDDPAAIARLADFADDPDLQNRLRRIRFHNKTRLAQRIRDDLDIKVDPRALFDVQIKRIHEYKRQLLNLLEVAALYQAIRAHPGRDWVPRVKVFAGKAAASYHDAKLIVSLAHDIARTVNNDPAVRDLLKVVFLPNYNVSLAEVIIPAADLSEQISTAGMEASGTGNMKLALNGALTIGTMDGANVEICERVGEENIFIFGLKADEVAARKADGYDPGACIAQSAMLAQVLDAIAGGAFSPGNPGRYRQLIDGLRQRDPFFLAADFDDYYGTQRSVDALWRDQASWWRTSILNTAHMCWFSSDRTISEYARDIWNVGIRGGAQPQAAHRLTGT